MAGLIFSGDEQSNVWATRVDREHALLHQGHILGLNQIYTGTSKIRQNPDKTKSTSGLKVVLQQKQTDLRQVYNQGPHQD